MEHLRRARDSWIASGENRKVTWKYVRRALMLATLSLSITLAGIVGWVARNQREDYESQVAYCEVREEASTKLSTFADAVKDFAAGVRDLVQENDPTDPDVLRLAALSDALAVAADSYQPVTFAECMATAN